MTARLLAAVVLPSDGVALVHRISFGSRPEEDESSNAVRSERKASVYCDFGCVRTLMLRSTVVMLAS